MTKVAAFLLEDNLDSCSVIYWLFIKLSLQSTSYSSLDREPAFVRRNSVGLYYCLEVPSSTWNTWCPRLTHFKVYYCHVHAIRSGCVSYGQALDLQFTFYFISFSTFLFRVLSSAWKYIFMNILCMLCVKYYKILSAFLRDSTIDKVWNKSEIIRCLTQIYISKCLMCLKQEFLLIFLDHFQILPFVR